MKKSNKILKVSLFALLLSFILITLGISLSGLDYLKTTNINIISLKKIEKENNDNIIFTEEYLSDFDNINIDLDYSNIEIKKSFDDKAHLKLKSVDGYYNYSIKNRTLSIFSKKYKLDLFNKKFFIRNFSFDKLELDINSIKNLLLGVYENENLDYEITLFLNKDNYDKLEINQGLGNLNCDNISIKNLLLNLNCVEGKIKNSNFNNIDINLNMGALKVENLKSDKAKINTDLGSIRLYNIDIDKMLKANNSVGKIDIYMKYNSNINYNLDVKTAIGKVFVDKNFNKIHEGNKVVDVELNNSVGKINLYAK